MAKFQVAFLFLVAYTFMLNVEGAELYRRMFDKMMDTPFEDLMRDDSYGNPYELNKRNGDCKDEFPSAICDQFQSWCVNERYFVSYYANRAKQFREVKCRRTCGNC